MASETDDFSDVISRRRFVELTGVSGAAALAGCSQSGDGTDTSDDGSTDAGTDGSGEMQVRDVTHKSVVTQDPTKLQYNVANTSNTPDITHLALFEPFANYNYKEKEWKPAGISSWDFNGDRFRMTIREGLTWSNGNAVTADDLVTQFEVAKEIGSSVFNWAGGVEKVDERTVDLTVEKDINPALVEVDVFTQGNGVIALDQETYGDKSDVQSFVDRDPVTNGPFTISKKSSSSMLLKRFGKHPDAGNINFKNMQFDKYSGNAQRQQALNNLEIDSDFSVPANARIVANFPDAVEELRYADVFGFGLTPNHDHPYAGDRAVRQAIAHAINRTTAVNNSLPRAKKTPDVLTGVPTEVQDKWLGDKKGQFETYGKNKKQTGKAASVLKDAGYSKQDGTWVDGDGNTVSLSITVPGGWPDWVTIAETCVQHLNEFGLTTRLKTTGDYFGDIQSDDFVFIANTWLHGGPTTYPYRSLLHQLWEPQQHAARYDYPPAKKDDKVGGSAESVTVPAMSGSGELTIENTGDRIKELSRVQSQGEAKKIVQELAWVANQDLPMIPVTEKLLQSWVTSDQWNVPQDLESFTEGNVEYPCTHLPRIGRMKYTG